MEPSTAETRPTPATLPGTDPRARRRFLVHLCWIAALGTAIDLATKSWAYRYLGDTLPGRGEWWPGVFVLRWTLNDGALFGSMPGRNLAFLALSVAAIPLIVWFFWTLPAHRWLPTVSLGGILAGTLGNLYDRVAFGGVRDFLYFEWINWPIFNVADVWICVCACLFALDVLLAGRKTPSPASAPGA